MNKSLCCGKIRFFDKFVLLHNVFIGYSTHFICNVLSKLVISKNNDNVNTKLINWSNIHSQEHYNLLWWIGFQKLPSSIMHWYFISFDSSLLSALVNFEILGVVKTLFSIVMMCLCNCSFSINMIILDSLVEKCNRK